MKVGERTLVVSSSVGVSLYPSDADDREGLIRCADAAMYLSKRAGKNRSSFANEAAFAGSPKNSATKARLR